MVLGFGVVGCFKVLLVGVFVGMLYGCRLFWKLFSMLLQKIGFFLGFLGFWMSLEYEAPKTRRILNCLGYFRSFIFMSRNAGFGWRR